VTLLKEIDRLWRLFATGIAFAAMGLGGVVLAIVVIPLASLPMRNADARARRAQAIIRASFRFYVAMLRLLGVINLDVVGEAQLENCSGSLIIANHPTLLDVVLVMALVPNAQCVVKHQLWRNPFLGPVVRVAGYIRNDEEGERFIESCRQALARGANLIIFPEGTRSVPGRAPHFQRGFAHVATMTGAGLQLIAITCDPITLVKGQPWYVIPERRPTFRVEIAERIEAKPFLDVGSRALGARKLVSHLESYYGGKLKHG
jgi:1-acyl-sn-glycerol-3-phosphate acyltransferase